MGAGLASYADRAARRHAYSVDEDEFWVRLEYRVSAELAGIDDDAMRFLWCDGFRPEEYRTNANPPSIRGRAWIGDPLNE